MDANAKKPEIRPCGIEEVEAWKRFLDVNFKYEQGQSYAVDFAPLFSRSALENSRLAWSGGEILSSASVHVSTAVSPIGKIATGIIGAVATRESNRGQGLSSMIIGELENVARKLGAEACVLWSDQEDFYAKLGYAPVGRQQVFDLSELPAPTKAPAGTVLYGWDEAAVKKIYDCHPLRSERSPQYWREIAKVTSCVRLQWVDPQGNLTAYIAFNRGKDLQGIVHEWGGEPEALRTLTWLARQQRGQLFWLTNPLLDDPVRDKLEGEPLMDGALCLCKTLVPGISKNSLQQLWFWGLDSL